jgi:preprotein translocase subunit SecG
LFTFLLILFLIVSFLLVVVILLQASKGDGLSGALGGGFMAQNIVGARQAANVLQKATVILGVLFGVLAITISLTIGGGSTTTKSVLQEEAAQHNSQLPVLKTEQPVTPPADTTK